MTTATALRPKPRVLEPDDLLAMEDGGKSPRRRAEQHQAKDASLSPKADKQVFEAR
jgi:hypothetical protein